MYWRGRGFTRTAVEVREHLVGSGCKCEVLDRAGSRGGEALCLGAPEHCPQRKVILGDSAEGHRHRPSWQLGCAPHVEGRALAVHPASATTCRPTFRGWTRVPAPSPLTEHRRATGLA